MLVDLGTLWVLHGVKRRCVCSCLRMRVFGIGGVDRSCSPQKQVAKFCVHVYNVYGSLAAEAAAFKLVCQVGRIHTFPYARVRKEKQHTKQLQPSQKQRKSNTTAMARQYILNILRELD